MIAALWMRLRWQTLLLRLHADPVEVQDRLAVQNSLWCMSVRRSCHMVRVS